MSNQKCKFCSKEAEMLLRNVKSPSLEAYFCMPCLENAIKDTMEWRNSMFKKIDRMFPDK
jgi:hypothetical protein